MVAKLYDNRKWLYLAAILAIALVVYWPSFSHLLRSETYVFFLNTHEYSSAFQYLNYQMEYMPGDSLLFRPLLYGTLGLEKMLFSSNYTLWHIGAFIAHSLAIVSLFRLLWLIRPSVLATLFALLFGTMYVSINAILYVQVAPYSLFIALTLTGLYYLYKGSPVVAIVCMFIASFFYEIGILFLILIGIYLWLNKSKSALWTVPATTTYLAMFLVQKINIGLINPELPSLSSIIHAPYLAGTWITQALIPVAFNVNPTPTLATQPVWFESIMILPILILNIIAIAVVTFSLWQKKLEGDSPTIRKNFKLLIGTMLIVFLLTVTIFRAESRGVSYILDTNINANMFLAWLILLTYTFLNFKSFGKKQIILASLALLFLIGVSSFKVYDVNQEINLVEQPSKAYIMEVDSFVKTHEDEQGFSLAVTTNGKIEENTTLELFKADSSWHKFSVPQILHLEHWDEISPKYQLHYSEGVLGEDNFNSMHSE